MRMCPISSLLLLLPPQLKAAQLHDAVVLCHGNAGSIRLELPSDLHLLSICSKREGAESLTGILLTSVRSTGLCRRRRWSDPLYECYQTTTGYSCTARVNHREYQTDTVYESESLARENAAMRAYLICRNFSVNDGMYPAGHKKGGIVQGLPVAIGTGRHSTYDAASSSSGGYASGGSSPRSSDSGADDPSRRVSRTARSLAYGPGHM